MAGDPIDRGPTSVLCTFMLAVILTATCASCNDSELRWITINGSGTYTSIQDAVDDAEDGDVIFVPNGRYKEDITVEQVGIMLTIIGESSTETIIDGTFRTGTHTIVKNMTLAQGILGVDILEIYGCRFPGSQYEASQGIVEGSTFDPCPGVAIWFEGHGTRVAYNDFIGCDSYAVLIRLFGLDELVANRFINGESGAVYYGTNGGIGVVQDNEFRGHAETLLPNPSHPIRGGGISDLGGGGESQGRNIFVDNPPPVLVGSVADTPQKTWAQHNYWGTTDPDQIDEMVQDCRDNSSLGCVDYSEFLTEEPDVPRGADAWPGWDDLEATVEKLTTQQTVEGEQITLFEVPTGR